ncbi:MAG: hypothetical protein KAQ78_11305, partial [Candidatus Latescibacteria bacterium]|nr:hypothetical protein [Candidatus Latescibacterota bacterium]
MAKSNTSKGRANLFEATKEEVNDAIVTPPSSSTKRTKTPTVNAICPDVTKDESRQEFFIPISGFIWLYPEEVQVVNHPIFQRLGNIYQLGQTYLVYRGATHTRMEHVLGTLHMTHRMIASMKYTHKKSLLRKEIT